MSQQTTEVEEVSGALPTRPRPGYVALYRFLDAAGELLYVGICDEPVKRWGAHRSEGRPRPRVHWRALPTPEAPRHTEAPSSACDGG